MKKALLLLGTCVLLGGCLDKQETSCSGESTQALIKDILTDGINKAIGKNGQNAERDMQNAFDGAKIRALVSQLNFSVVDVRTTKNDPDSSKKFCAGTLNITLPADYIRDANKARELMSLASLEKFAQDSGTKLEANRVEESIEYSVQPTDDGKKLFASLDNGSKSSAFTADILTAVLVKGVLEKRQLEVAKAEAENASREQQQAAEQAQVQHELAAIAVQKARQKLDDANGAINLVWQSASKERRSQLLAEQRIWLKQRDLECKLKASQTTDEGGSEKEQARLGCETEMTLARINELKSKILN